MNNKSIHDLFICKYNNCNRYFVEPVMLECGRSVCKEHAEEMLKESQELSKPKGTYTCKLCLKEHHVPTEGFLFNKDLEDVLKSSGHLSALQVEIKKAIAFRSRSIDYNLSSATLFVLLILECRCRGHFRKSC